MNSCCPETSVSYDLAVLFSTGALISFGHCLGMCGPFIGAFSLGQAAPDAPRPRWLSHARYHGGRLGSYAMIGAVFAVMGGLVGWMTTTRASIALITGSLMLTLCVAWFLGRTFVLKRRLGIARRFDRVLQLLKARFHSIACARSGRRQFGLGLANGFLPCGPVYTVALTAAATGHWAKGALAMLAFGLGTVPALVLVALGAGRISNSLRKKLYTIGMVSLLLISVQLVMRGLSSIDAIPHFSIGAVVLW